MISRYILTGVFATCFGVANACEIPNGSFDYYSDLLSPSRICSWVAGDFVGTEVICDRSSWSDQGTWLVAATNVSESDPSFIEIELQVIGPSAQMTGYTGVGFESVTMRILGLYNNSCEMMPYIYIRLPRLNRRSFDELVGQNPRNNEIFNSHEALEPFQLRVRDAIVQGVVSTVTQ